MKWNTTPGSPVFQVLPLALVALIPNQASGQSNPSMAATAKSSSEITLSVTESLDSFGGTYMIQWVAGGASNPSSWTEGDSLIVVSTALIPGETVTRDHTGLQASTTYWYRFRAVDPSDVSVGGSWFDNISATTLGQTVTVLPEPENVAATTSANGVSLAWTTVADITYEIQWDTVGTSQERDWKTGIPNQTTSPYSHTDVAVGASYLYRIRAASKTGSSDEPSSWVATQSATIAGGQLAAVDGFALQKLDSTSVGIAWTTHGRADGYVLERAEEENAASWTTLNITVEPQNPVQGHTDTGLGQREYFYRIKATNTASLITDSEWTVESISTANVTVAAVTGLKATSASRTQINVTWNAYSDTLAIASLQIQWGLEIATLNNVQTVSRAATSWQHTGLKTGTRYYYRIRARGTGSIFSDWSTTVAATPGGETTATPRAPSNLTARADGRGAITLTWAAPADTTLKVKHYQISVSPDGAVWNDNLATTTGLTYKHTGLDNGVTRHYRVAAVDTANARSAWSNTARATTESAKGPSAPRNLVAAASADGITLTWTAPSDSGGATITSYRIEQSRDGGSSWTTLASVAGDILTYRHSDPPPGQSIHYRVFAINRIGDSPASNTASATAVRKIPTAPRSLAGRASAEGNSLSWTAPADTGSATLSGYRVEQSRDGGVGWTVLVNVGRVTSYVHRNPPPGQTIHYRVIAINRFGESPPSNVVDVRTLAKPPSPPLNLTARALGTTVSLNWNAPTDDGGGAITGYRIEVEVFDAWSVLAANTQSTATSYRHTDLTPGSTLRYRVFAINSGGRSPSSNVVRVEVAAVPPDPPTGVGAVAQGHDEISIAWSPPTNTGGAKITSYRIEFSNDGTFWRVLSANFSATSTVYRHAGLEPAKKYYYRIFAINKAGRSEPSTVVQATTLADLPGVPRGLLATVRGPTRIDLSWRPPDYTGGTVITGYQIEVSPDGTSWGILVDNTDSDQASYQHQDLTPSTTYYYRVSAINEVGVGAPSRVVEAKTEATLPGQPTNLQASAKSHEEIVLTWLAPEFDGGAAITGYLIEYSVDGGSSWTVIRSNTGSKNTVYAHKGLTPATVYRYRVAANNRVGRGERSEVAEAKTHAVVPDPPRDLTAEAVSPNQIDLKWTEPKSDGGAPITSYLIEASSDKREWERLADIEDAATEYEHTGVVPGQTWYYRVLAINEAGSGPASNIATATTDDPIERAGRVTDAILPRFAATAVSSSLRAISARVDAVAEGDSADQRISLLNARDGDLRSLANGASVVQTAHDGLSIWGNADLTGLSDGGTVEWNGEVFSVHAGIDGMLRDGVLVGLAGSRSTGAFDFTDRMGARDVTGSYDAILTSMNPYVAWVRSDVSVWATTGFGWGSISLADSLEAERSSNISSSVIAVGGSKGVYRGPLGAFKLRAEGWTSTVEVAGNVPAYVRNGFDPAHINPASYRMRRARLMLDWAVFTKTYGSHRTEVTMRGGARYDRNQLHEGVGGAEFGGKLRFMGPVFRAFGDGRVFIPHDSGYREWGVAAMIEIRSRHNRGLALRINPSYGNADSGIEQLWERGAGYGTTGHLGGRINAVLEYPLPTFGAKPYWRVNLTEDQRELYTGFSYRLLGSMDLKTEAARRGGINGLSLRGLWRF